MKRRSKLWLRILLASALAGLAFWLLRPKEPVYEGRTASAWLDALASKKKKADPYTALKKIGTNALPYAVRNLVRNDSRWRGGYKNLWSKLPKRLQQIMPQLKPNLQVVDGANVFFSIGSDAIPYAIALLKHESSTVRQSAAWGLCALRRKTPAADQAIPALTEALADPDERVQIYALLAFMEIGPAASNAVPAITKVLASPQTNALFYVRANAALALGKIGPAAKSALPLLKAALTQPSLAFRSHAAVAIWRIDGDVDTALPVLLLTMPGMSAYEKSDWIIALGEMGPRAAKAFPQLVQELKENDLRWFLEHVTNSMVSIDPDAAVKIGVHKPASKPMP